MPGTSSDDLRIIAIDWSGRHIRAERHIWLAEVVRGELRRLECGRSREEMTAHLLRMLDDPHPAIVGLDFAFSAPDWFVRACGAMNAFEFWRVAEREGERWLRECADPFWGRGGRRMPRDMEQLRATDRACPPVAGIRPKSVFQIGGAGAVGTGAVRGMPMLATLHDAGFAVWPFCAPARQTLIEIYPRACTGAVRKSERSARERYLRREYRHLPDDAYDQASQSDDAFDALVSALRMWDCRDDLEALRRTTDPIEQTEGAIWWPGDRTGGTPPADTGAMAWSASTT